jgi:hypothetical protein
METVYYHVELFGLLSPCYVGYMLMMPMSTWIYVDGSQLLCVIGDRYLFLECIFISGYQV